MKKLPNRENRIYLGWRIVWTVCVCAVIIGLVVSFFSLNTGFEGMTPPMTVAVGAAISIAGIPLYTLPAFFAYRKEHPARRALLWVNLLLGWTVAGYIACIVWCAKSN
ncbi:MAG: superinfection immunity protein [Clostridia bacterium]|nr:superinfection immunity protein [Clostridia bacterium]